MNMQGFGSTFASGFYKTTTSGFGAAASMGATARSMNFSAVNRAEGSSALAEMHDNPLMTEGPDEEEEERRAQMEFEQSMRATSMSFFKTVKSTFMSTNDLQSEIVMGESQKAWGEPNMDEDEGSDLMGNAEQVMTGGSLSLLRRKGGKNKDRRRDRDPAERVKFNSELLSNDI